MFNKPAIRTKSKYHRITVKGVTLWNNCTEAMKACLSLQKFTRLYKNKKRCECEKKIGSVNKWLRLFCFLDSLGLSGCSYFPLSLFCTHIYSYANVDSLYKV